MKTTNKTTKTRKRSKSNKPDRKAMIDLKLFFLEDSLTDYQFSYQSHQISY